MHSIVLSDLFIVQAMFLATPELLNKLNMTELYNPRHKQIL